LFSREKEICTGKRGRENVSPQRSSDCVEKEMNTQKARQETDKDSNGPEISRPFKNAKEKKLENL